MRTIYAHHLSELMPVFEQAMKDGCNVICFNYNKPNKMAYVVTGKRGYRRTGTVYKSCDDICDAYVPRKYKSLPPKYWFDCVIEDELPHIIIAS